MSSSSIAPRAGIDPAIQQIFDQMIAYMGTTYEGMTCVVNKTVNNVSETVTCRAPDGGLWTYSESVLGPRVALAPLTASLGPGGTQQFTATCTNADGTPANNVTLQWSASGGGGTVSQTGLYTAPATIAATVTDTVTARATQSGSSASVTVSLIP